MGQPDLAGDPIAAVQQRLLTLMRDVEREGEQAADLASTAVPLTGRAASADGAISVVVDGNGVPTQLRLSERIRGVRPDDLADRIMACLRHAQADLATTMAAKAGANPFAQRIAHSYAVRFPQPEPGPAPAPPPTPSVASPRPVRPAPHPPRGGDDPRDAGDGDDDFGGGVLRRATPQGGNGG